MGQMGQMGQMYIYIYYSITYIIGFVPNRFGTNRTINTQNFVMKKVVMSALNSLLDKLQFEAKTQKVSEFICKHESVELSTVSRKFRTIKNKEREKIIDLLLDSGAVTQSKAATGGRSKTVLTWTVAAAG
jgi:hypothetical protein